MIEEVFILKDTLRQLVLAGFQGRTSGMVTETSRTKPLTVFEVVLRAYEPTSLTEVGVWNPNLYKASFGGGGAGNGTTIP
jgi:hypothetical protein